MPRPTIKIDTILMQEIADHDICKDLTAASHLYKYIAEQYNTRKNNILYPTDIDFQLVGLRIKTGAIKLSYPLPAGKRGNQSGTPLSAEHKAKLLSGKINSRKTQNNMAGLNAKWADKMTAEFDNKKNLLAGLLKGNARACVKAMCIRCMGGYKNRTVEDPSVSEAIRDCRGVSCPLYIIRPFQKKNEEPN